MSTKVGLIAEGPIDYALLPALLERIARVQANYDWPVNTDDMAEVFPIRRRGHGGVLQTIRQLVAALDTPQFGHAFFVILLDRRTRPIQRKLKAVLRGRHRFVLGIAIEEIEAWWLGDRKNTLRWSGLERKLPGDARYAVREYKAEKDPDPKKTLDELTMLSDRFDRRYGEGNVDLAQEFARDYWRDFANLEGIRAQCPRGFGPFEKATANKFRAARANGT